MGAHRLLPVAAGREQQPCADDVLVGGAELGGRIERTPDRRLCLQVRIARM